MSLPRRVIQRFWDTSVGYAHLLRAEWTSWNRTEGLSHPERYLLLLAPTIPPDRVLGGTYRPTSFLQHAEESGWRTAVITRQVKGPPDDAARYMAARIPSSCTIVRVSPPRHHPIGRIFPSIDGTIEMAVEVFDEGRRRFCHDPPAVIVATGPPFHNFLSGYYLSRLFRSRLVVDYRDEWTECPLYFVSSGPWDRFFEKRILRRADGVLFTTRSQLEHAVERFPQLRADKCFMLPNGWDPTDAASASQAGSSYRNRDGTTVISFVGTLGAHTHPGDFLDMLGSLVRSRPDLEHRIRVRFVGRIASNDMRAALDQFTPRLMIEQVGLVPLPEAQREMRRADVLVFFTTPDLERYRPGKLFEYLAAERPVMVYGASGEAAELVTGLAAGRRVAGPEDFLEFLDRLDEFRTAFSKPALQQWLADNRRDVLAGRFFEILERVSTNQQDWPYN